MRERLLKPCLRQTRHSFAATANAPVCPLMTATIANTRALLKLSVCVNSAHNDKPLLIQHYHACLQANRSVLYGKRFVVAYKQQIVGCGQKCVTKTCKCIPEL